MYTLPLMPPTLGMTGLQLGMTMDQRSLFIVTLSNVMTKLDATDETLAVSQK